MTPWIHPYILSISLCCVPLRMLTLSLQSFVLLETEWCGPDQHGHSPGFYHTVPVICMGLWWLVYIIHYSEGLSRHNTWIIYRDNLWPPAHRHTMLCIEAGTSKCCFINILIGRFFNFHDICLLIISNGLYSLKDWFPFEWIITMSHSKSICIIKAFCEFMSNIMPMSLMKILHVLNKLEILIKI